ncbi:MAG: Gfo/Idh/MocA family oxidoreductase [Clostridiales bacterium]|jgi:predicted dehydrogenase|nr:Gfo/Idh/MocA family oxidoreductase [Clostridiales bacterium]
MLKVGIVGGRGLSTIAGFQNRPELCEVSAICDIDGGVLDDAVKKHGIPRSYRIFDDMLDSDIDAVVIATPMHCHVPMAIQALERGLHVLSEVTAGVTIDELWWLIEAVEKSKKTYMFAENYCYIPQNAVIKAMVNDGLFGKVYFGEGEYIHNVLSLVSRSGFGMPTWRKYWQLGKRGCFYPTHSVGPVAQWFEGDSIKSVMTCSSGQNVAEIEGLRQDDTTLTMCRLESGGLVKIRVDCMSPRPHNMSYYSLQGTKGCYEAPRGLGDEHKIWLEASGDGDNRKWAPLSDYYDKYLPERYKNATEKQKQSGHWGGDFFLVDDFLDAVINGKKPAIDVYDACEWTAVGLLSELSVTNGGRAIDMPRFRPGTPLSEQIIKL